ncbi:MAG: aryl-sulfate sulfotransferase [Gammaproteobacteria bacterium]|nr:aryl-sulfate sulfotransferase [Gammaproteobacteria bacterium]
MELRNTIAALLLTALSAVCVSACMPATEENVTMAATAPESEQRRPKFRSAKTISSICDVYDYPFTFPGFKNFPGRPVVEMPPPFARMMAVGADRPMVETDPERVAPGYTVIQTFTAKDGLIINNDREELAVLENRFPIMHSEILPNGHRIVEGYRHSARFALAGGYTGCLEEYDEHGNMLWQLNLASDEYTAHHDFAILPNGNILTITWESVTADQAISQGRDPETVPEDGDFWYDGVIEIDPYNAEIVWEWSVRHHIIQEFDSTKPNYGVVADHPELWDINKFVPSFVAGGISADWAHFNAIDYNPELDQILLSSNFHGEFYVIDHSATPYEAADHKGGRYGKGGDILYRWGNPANYNRGTQEERELWGQHDVQWIRDGLNGAGNILIFNNGGPDRPWSTVIEIEPPMNADGSYVLNDGEAYGPTEKVWLYDPEPPERFFSFFVSGAQRLPNGNTLVNHGAGAKVREVTADGEIVWEYRYTDYDVPPAGMFRANKYPPDHPGVLKILEAQRN